MASRNAYHYEGTLQEAIAEVIEQHRERLNPNARKLYFREPSAHDQRYYSDLDRAGRPVFMPDGVPVEPSLGQPEPEDIADRVRRQIQGKVLAERLQELGVDSFEEANDFEVEENQDKCPFSGHEYSEQDEANDAVAWANEVKRREEEEQKQSKEKKRQEYLDLKNEFEKTNPPASTSPSAGEGEATKPQS